MAHSESRFRAIIVGAGPAGLATAHCLSAAAIDFVILERRNNVIEESGASLGLWPQSVRLLHQLHLIEAGNQISKPLELSYHFDQRGKQISAAPIFDMIEKRYVFR
jgi:2-polyprenyl-6-methoxyphenol hydroxylase-like FAD-dependent oxidoreductase